MKRILLLLGLFSVLVACTSPTSQCTSRAWYKGDLHARCISPGGAVALDAIKAWRINKGYDFLVIDTTCRPETWDSTCVFLLGNENIDEKTVRTTAINTTVPVWTALSLREAVRNGSIPSNILSYIPVTCRDLISHHLLNIGRAGGLAVLSQGVLDTVTPAQAAEIDGLSFVEIFAGDTLTESSWDSLLTRGKKVFGTASDTSFSGRGWVMVQADSCTPPAIIEALKQGYFYASSGVILAEAEQQDTNFVIKIDTAATRKQIQILASKPTLTGTATCEIHFITSGGKIAKHTPGIESSYAIKPDDKYVRAKISYSPTNDSLIYYAWTQAIQPF